MVPKICISCGATMTGGRCEYCGTEYENNGATGTSDSFSVQIVLNGESIDCYIGHIETIPVQSSSSRLPDGTMIRSRTHMKRKITLIEI